MRKLIALGLVLSLSLAVAGCSSGGGAAPSNSTTTKPAAPAGVSYQVIPMEANEKAAEAIMPAVVAEYVAGKKKDGKIEGKDWLDVTGVAPEFIGYNVNAFVPGATADQVKIVEVSYVNGLITLASMPGKPLSKSNAEPRDLYKTNAVSGPASPGSAEKKALAAAKAWVAENYPGTDWTYGVKQYLFLYRKGDVGVYIGTTLVGELDRSSGIIQLAK
jgi:hypothetical protein